MKRLLLFLVICIIMCGCSETKKEIEVIDTLNRVEQNVETINKSHDSTNSLAAKMIIDGVAQAYMAASLQSMGDYPTIEDIRNSFNVDNANWEGSKIVYKNFECNVSTNNNLLNVKCLDEELKGEYRIK